MYYTLYGDLIKAVDNAKDDVDRPISVPEKVADLMELTFQGAELLDIENTTFGVQLAILDGKTLKIVELTHIYMEKYDLESFRAGSPDSYHGCIQGFRIRK